MSVTVRIAGLSIGITTILHYLIPQHPTKISTTLLIFFALYAGYTVWSLVIYPAFYSPLRHVPVPPGGHWFWGHTQAIVDNPTGTPQRGWIEKVPNDGLLRYSVYGQLRLLVTNPATLGELLVTKAYEFTKPSPLRQSLGRILGVGVLLAEGDEHKRQRKHLMPAFAFRHVKDLYPVFWNKAQEMTDRLLDASKSTEPTVQTLVRPLKSLPPGTKTRTHAPGIIDVYDFASRATLDIIGIAGIGRDFGSLADPNSELREQYRKMFALEGAGSAFLRILGLFVPIWVLVRIPTQGNKNVAEAAAKIKAMSYDMIAQKRKTFKQDKTEKEKANGVDIISVAMASGGFTDEDLVNQNLTFLLAGHETTSTAVTWAIYLLTRHKAIQSRLRAEVRAHIPSAKSSITASDIDNCHYLQAVCHEVLRLQSPVTMTLRVAATNTSLAGVSVPKGTPIIIAPWAINTSTAVWGPDAMEFKPERWLDADGKADHRGGSDSAYGFLTFLHGPRGCIGQRFAEAEFACLLAAWIGRFESTFEDGFDENAELEQTSGVTTKPKGGMWVKLKEVEGW